MINYIPKQSTKKFNVSYIGDFFGDIINAFNLDLFSARGKARTGTKVYPHTIESDITGITPPSQFVSAEIDDGTAWKTFTAAVGSAPLDILTFGSAHGYVTGDAIQIKSTTALPTPFVQYTTYYVIYVSTNTIFLATTLANATAGTHIVITTNGVGTYSSKANSVTTVGSRKIWGVADSKKIIRSLASTLPIFTLDTSTGFDSAETTATGSDILTLKDDSGDILGPYTALTITETATGTSNQQVGAAAANTRVAQSFTGIAGNLQSIIFYARKFGTPTDNMIIEIQADTAGAPSGTPLVSHTIDQATLTTSFVAQTVLGGGVVLLATSTYWIVWRRSGANDPTNLGDLKIDLTQNPYTSGNMATYNPTTWTNVTAADVSLSLNIFAPSAVERLYVSTNKDIRFLNVENGVWQSLWKDICQQPALDSNYPHPMKNIGSGGLIFLGDGNLLHSVFATATDSSDATNGRLVFPDSHYINWIEVTKSAVFIGLQDKSSENLPSIVCYYEPFSEVTRLFYIQEGATRGWIENENCLIVDKSGQIRQFTGSDFRAVDYFPTYFTSQSVTLPHRNAFVIKDGITRILWEGAYPYGAGIWTRENGNLYHRNSLVFSKTTLNSYGTMDAVTGWRALYYTGANYVLGALIKDNTLATIQGVFSDYNVSGTPVATENRGSFVSSKFTTPDVTATWQRIYAKYDTRRNGTQTGSIVLKKRHEKMQIGEGVNATAFSGTWTSSTTFTCATASFISAVDSGYITTDQEIIFRTGQGSGLLAQISSIAGAVAGTKTITIDSGLSAISSGSMTFSVENWNAIANNKPMSKSSEWMQCKIQIRDSVDLEEIQCGSTRNQSADER